MDGARVETGIEKGWMISEGFMSCVKLMSGIWWEGSNRKGSWLCWV